VLTMEPQTYRLQWQGIEIAVTYTPLKWGVIAHLEIRSITPAGARLPISSTGYRSHFHQPGTIEAHGGDVISQVVAWLDEEAKDPEWQRYRDISKQGELF